METHAFRVFVSSTFEDLKDHRQSVQDALRQLGAIDISMERFGARDERPKDECLRLISQESDLFVGIYAHRYGFIPEDEDRSITQAEYDSAGGQKRLIYLVADDTPWLPKHIDKGPSAQRLEEFKQALRTNHICKFFSSKDQLATFVAADVGRELLRTQLRSELLRTQLSGNERRRRGMEILLEAQQVSGILAAAQHLETPDSATAESKFWQLYYGPLIGVENSQVESGMVRVGEGLKRWRSDAKKPSDLQQRCLALSQAIASQLRDDFGD